MLGGAGADRLFGGTGDDVLAGDSGTKVTGLIERAGREADYDGEIEVVAAGSDTLDGGAGYDTADYLFSATAIRASLRQGTATGEGVDRLIGIEGLIGSRFDDVLEGNDDNNALAGGKGNDTLRGLGGNDSIIGSAGADQIDGGAGLDTLFYDSIVKLALRAERISINAFRLETILGTTGEARGDTYVNVERFEGSDAGDSISMTGDAALNADGGSGADTLSGGNGRDRLSGGAGSDMLTGGAGADIFVFATPVVAGNADMITDFGTGDRIALENAVFIGIGGAGGLSADAFHLGRTASDAEDRILYDRARGELFYDRDGRGGTAAILFAQLDNGTLLGAGNFLVI